MANSRITAKEYERIVKRLEFNITTRTNLLTLSFTTVFALLAIALTAEPEKINSFIFIMPFFLIIPFAARITYYRITYARMYAFLMTFASDDMQFAIIGKQVPENHHPKFSIITFLNNYELFLLAFVNTIIFYYKYIPTHKFDLTSYETAINCFACAAPFVLTIFVAWIIHYGFAYNQWESRYQNKWKAESLNQIDQIELL